MEVFEETTEGATNIKKEVSVLCNGIKSSSSKTSDYCNGSSSHTIKYVSESEHQAKGRRRDSIQDSSSTGLPNHLETFKKSKRYITIY